ncbi:hypothetical protein GCM10023083_45950 [Streptomyces phyllanthi]
MPFRHGDLRFRFAWVGGAWVRAPGAGAGTAVSRPRRPYPSLPQGLRPFDPAKGAAPPGPPDTGLRPGPYLGAGSGPPLRAPRRTRIRGRARPSALGDSPGPRYGTLHQAMIWGSAPGPAWGLRPADPLRGQPRTRFEAPHRPPPTGRAECTRPEAQPRPRPGLHFEPRSELRPWPGSGTASPDPSRGQPRNPVRGPAPRRASGPGLRSGLAPWPVFGMRPPDPLRRTVPDPEPGPVLATPLAPFPGSPPSPQALLLKRRKG